MSYIPDYRCEENEKLLSQIDRAFLLGYRAALEDGQDFFNNLDIYGIEIEEDEDDESSVAECFANWMDMQETENVCGLFESADYIPDDVEIKDVNLPLFPSLKAQREARKQCEECEIHFED